MLDICITVFTDNGVKYVVIPKNISRELQQNVHLFKNAADSPANKRERLLYDSFVHNNSCDDYSVNKIVVPSVILNLLDLKYVSDIPSRKNIADNGLCSVCDKRTYAIYRNTYHFFLDIRKYLYRNSENKKDFLNTYFNLCYDTVSELIDVFLFKNDSVADCMGATIAIFRNIVDTMNMDVSDDYNRTFNDRFVGLLNDLNAKIKIYIRYNDAKRKEILNRITAVVLCIIFQMEYEFDVQRTKKNGVLSSCSQIKDIVYLLFYRVYSDFSSAVKKNGICNGDMSEVVELINQSKNIIMYLSSGMLNKECIHNLEFQRLIYCADRVIHDLNLYIMHGSVQAHSSIYLMSTFVFIYEDFLRGGSVI